MLRLRLCELFGCPLAELDEWVTVDELPVWSAYAEQFGPWWSVRGDYQAARVVHAVLAAAGVKPGSLTDHLIAWGTAEAVPARNLLPYADGMRALAGMLGRKPG